MLTEQLVKQNFLKDLKAVLQKYDAEFDVSVTMHEFGAMVDHIEIYIPTSYDIDGELIREETIITLSKWFDHECL